MASSNVAMTTPIYIYRRTEVIGHEQAAGGDISGHERRYLRTRAEISAGKGGDILHRLFQTAATPCKAYRNGKVNIYSFRVSKIHLIAGTHSLKKRACPTGKDFL